MNDRDGKQHNNIVVTKIEKEDKHTFLIQIGLGLYILQIYYLVVEYKLRLERDTIAFNVNV